MDRLVEVGYGVTSIRWLYTNLVALGEVAIARTNFLRISVELSILGPIEGL